MVKNRIAILAFMSALLGMELWILWYQPPSLSDGWFSDIAYHLNWNFSGTMAPDIPYGGGWSTGIGKIFFLVHYIAYKLIGVGIFQARLASLAVALALMALVYYWASINISRQVGIYAAVILAVSVPFASSLHYVRQEPMHALFAFVTFICLNNGLKNRNNKFFFLAGFVAAEAVDVSWRGVEIVLTAYLMNLLVFEKGQLLKRTSLMLAGSFIAFLGWFAVNILPIGLDNFVKYHLTAGLGDGGPYTLKTLLSEFERFGQLLWGNGVYSEIGRLEVFYILVLLIAAFKFQSVASLSRKHIWFWLASSFFVMSVVEKTTGISLLLVYYPYLAIVAGAGFQELITRRSKIAYAVATAILIASLALYGGRFQRLAKEVYIERCYDPAHYYNQVRASVDITRGIIGTTNHWYAFIDSRYYGGQFYLSRVSSILGELQMAKDYKDERSRAQALLNVFRKRQIEYIVGCQYFLPTISCYFPNGELPAKNFTLVNTISDHVLGGGAGGGPPYQTKIFRVISYDYSGVS